MQIVISELDSIKGKKVYTDVITVDVPEFTQDYIYHAMRNTYGFSTDYMDEAWIHVGNRIAVVTWEGIEFNMVRDASLSHF